ncbi:starch-binding protein, partial [Acinetobacter pittii]|uniref:starch-binding protein n=2 Tax=Pseudomonadati TaxID=3379134 RepID=UPI00300C89AA
MISEGNGWYKYTFPNVTSLNVIFNNGNSGVGTNQTADINNVTSDVWYVWATQTLSTKEINTIKDKIILYPNPATDVLS